MPRALTVTRVAPRWSGGATTQRKAGREDGWFKELSPPFLVLPLLSEVCERWDNRDSRFWKSAAASSFADAPGRGPGGSLTLQQPGIGADHFLLVCSFLKDQDFFRDFSDGEPTRSRRFRAVTGKSVIRRLAMGYGLLFLVVGGALAIFGLFLFWTEPLLVLGALERLTPNIVYRVRTHLPLVALSFDDGPHPTFTPQVLEILERHAAKATFFLIGERIWRHPDVVARLKARGHELGNHYLRDGSTLGDSDAEFVCNLEQTERALGGSEGLKFFRPPGGVAWPRQIKLARERGYTSVLGCAYPHDPMHPPVRYIRWLVEKNLVPGAIVILHDGIPDARRSLGALPHILAAGQKKGLRFVSIGQLMNACRRAAS